MIYTREQLRNIRFSEPPGDEADVRCDASHVRGADG